jgi:hypothetical protein
MSTPKNPADQYFSLFAIVPAILGRLWEKRELVGDIIFRLYKVAFYAFEGKDRDMVTITEVTATDNIEEQ